MEAVGRLAGGVAHDFNNMLTIISGYNRMLLDELSMVDPLRGYAEGILKAADRAAALIRQLLTFSRRQLIQPRLLNVNSLIRNTEKILQRLVGEDIELTMVLRPKDGVAAKGRQDEGGSDSDRADSLQPGGERS
jgi:signal transduction histidine kinase